MAKRSFSSGMYANVIEAKFFQANIQVNSSTIIFLDFSINDNLGSGAVLERLVRKIYFLAADKSSLPMVILLDMRAGDHQIYYKVCEEVNVQYSYFCSSLLYYSVSSNIFVYS
jgi:hypothetical protein